MTDEAIPCCMCADEILMADGSIATPTDLSNTVKAFREHNFDVSDFEHNHPEYIISFRGDFPDEGLRAAQLIKQLGYVIFQLRYVWFYDALGDDEIEGPSWEISL